MNETTLKKVIVKNNGTREAFLPEMVEKCMVPGTYDTYPVEIIKKEDEIIIKSLRKTKIYAVDAIIEKEEYTIPKPGKVPCDGNCGSCGKCS